MMKAYKYRLHPNKEQTIFFEKSFGCARYVYNWALNKRIESYQKDGTRLGWADCCKMLTNLKKQEDTKWLCEVSNQSLQSSIRNMDSAFTRFFREKKGFPKYKSKKHNKQSFQLVQQVSVDFENNRVKLPKIGNVKFGKNRMFDGKIGTCTISKTKTGRYYISILVEDNKPTPQKAPISNETSVGVDVGIKDFAVLSNGDVYSNPKYFEKDEKRIKVLQKRLSKKQKGSNRYIKAKYMLARRYEKTNNKRTDFIHKVSSKIVRENQTIIIEDLNVDGMLKNHCLAKHISSASWSEFFRQLQYKCDWYGKNLIRIGRFEPSSKMCLCGYINKELDLKDREWDCPNCGRRNDRDLLAAVNIKRFGLQSQNLISENINTPVVDGVGGVELLTLVGALKRQYVQV